MTGTTIADALDALVTLFAGAVDPDALQVLDGGPAIDPQLDYLCVGFDMTENAAVSVTRSIADAAMGRDQEEYDISSVLSAWNGTETISQNRQAALGYFATLQTALRADFTLGGKVTRALIIDYDLDQDVSTLGIAVNLRFTTHITAFK